MKVVIKHLVFTLLLAAGVGFTHPLLAQEQTLKDLVETKRERKFAFYPSTLRMVNLSKNQAYEEMVSGVEKLLVYTLDSATRADRSYTQITTDYQLLGFEEYASVMGGQMMMAVMGLEGEETNQFVGYVGQGDAVIAFYLRGTIAWQKIPTLINTLKEEDMLLDIFDLKSN